MKQERWRAGVIHSGSDQASGPRRWSDFPTAAVPQTSNGWAGTGCGRGAVACEYTVICWPTVLVEDNRGGLGRNDLITENHVGDHTRYTTSKLCTRFS